MQRGAKQRLVLYAFAALVLWCCSNVVQADTNICCMTISTNTTWTLAGSPYILGGVVKVEGASTPVLTIEPGVVIKVNSNGVLRIGQGAPGALNAVGTPAQPITFQWNTTGQKWPGIELYQQFSTASSAIAYMNVKNATIGISTTNLSPSMHHVTFEGNTNGFRANGWGNPTIYESSFIGNTYGIDSAGTQVNANFCWWNSATGPSGSGPGSGQWVHASVKYDPWLISAPTNDHYFSSGGLLRNRTFNPNIGINAHLTFETSASADWTITIKNSSNTTVKTLTGSGSSQTVDWDGTNQSGSPLVNGTYNYQLDSAGSTTISATGKLTINRNLAMTINSPSMWRTHMSPNGDNVQEDNGFGGSTGFDGGTWTLNVKNSGSQIVRTYVVSASSVNYVWNGKDENQVVVPDGTYTMEYNLVNDAAQATTSLTFKVDCTLPTANFTFPAPGEVISNVYLTTNGSEIVALRGTASDVNLDFFTVYWGVGSSPTGWNGLGDGLYNVTNSVLKNWDTSARPNGTYTVRLYVKDKAGNTVNTYVTHTIGNFRITKNAEQFNAAMGGSVTYTSTVPFPLNQTLIIKNQAGQVVRTLQDAASRAAGTYNDVWNGLDQQGGWLSTGGYYFVTTVTAGTWTMTIDRTNEYLAESNQAIWVNVPSFFDPFKNNPLTCTFTINLPGVVRFQFDQTYPGIIPCTPPRYCWFDKFYESGTHTVYWGGVDGANAYRRDLQYAHVELMRNAVSKNTTVVYGTRPSLSGLAVTPYIYNPEQGDQLVSFTNSTFQNQSSDVTITIVPLGSLSLARTVQASGVPSGVGSVYWDGKDSNGNYLTPGQYIVTVNATDGLGQTATGQVITTIKY